MRKLILALLIISCSKLLLAKTTDSTFYYVVVGGFAKVENAIRYQAKVNKDSKLVAVTKDQFNAKYELNRDRNINYVYILKTTNRRKAFALNIKLKAETEYKDSWVFMGDLESKEAIVQPVEKISLPPEPIQKKEPAIVIDPSKVDSAQVVATSEPEKKTEGRTALEGKPFVFRLSNKASGKEVTGAVHIYESAKASEYQSFKANEICYVPPPDNQAGNYLIKIQAPGYKPADKTIKFGTFDSLKLDQQATLVSFELAKVNSGDYIDFNNVHFVKNSALLTADSKNELDGLVDFMKENPKYKIRIHGFCNGEEKREIISRGTSEKFFELEPEKNKKHVKSAKELSLEHAEIVKDFLISQGIEAARLSVKAEGGGIPLYGEKSAMAFHNDRIEIEIRSN